MTEKTSYEMKIKINSSLVIINESAYNFVLTQLTLVFSGLLTIIIETSCTDSCKWGVLRSLRTPHFSSIETSIIFLDLRNSDRLCGTMCFGLREFDVFNDIVKLREEWTVHMMCRKWSLV